MLQVCCLLVWMMGITSVNTLRSRNSELNTTDLVITGYQSLGNVHIDGQEKLVTNARNWSLTDHVALSSMSRLIALEGMISNGEPSCAGVLASVDDSYLLTSSLWKCSTYNAVNWTQLGFDDSAWPNAVEYGSNGNHATCTHQRHFDDISSNAKWIWSYDLNTLAVYCRGYLPLCQTSSPCQNGGTCLPNHRKICDCPPEYTGTYCESRLMDEALVITAYQQLQLMYIDGEQQTLINGNMWNQTDRAGLTKTNRLIAVKAVGDRTCGGILASFGDDYVLTNAQWRCSQYQYANWYGLGFDDSQENWFNAVEFGSNEYGHTHCSHIQYIPDISANAMWIWFTDQTEESVFCRGYMPVCDSSPCLNNGTCLQNKVELCRCLPQFTGTYCETEILTTLETTKTTTVMTTHPQTTQGVTTGTLRTTEVTTLPQTTQGITTSNLQTTEVTTLPQTTPALCQTSSHCLNGGTCVPNQEKMCDCPPQFTGTYCETELMDGSLVITAYQQLPLMYIDGIEESLINCNTWNQTDRAGLTETNRLVAVKAVGDGTCGGLLASFGDAYFLTNAKWRCSPWNHEDWYKLGFDDLQSSWSNAVEFGSNADGHAHCSHLQYIPDISANAMWIWVPDQTEKSIYCRGYMPVCELESPCLNGGVCLTNNQSICSCLPGFVGAHCETVDTKQLRITASETLSAVYVDSKPIPLLNGTVSISPDSITVGSLSRVIAVMAIHQAFSCPGILLSITDDKGDYVVSDSGWKCTNNAKTGWYEPGYDDSAWQTAVEVKLNGDTTNDSVCAELPQVNGISSNAFWIWTNAQPIHDVAIYCRKILPICEAMPCQNGATCNETEDRLCTCLPGFSGIYCEQILPPSTIIDSRS